MSHITVFIVTWRRHAMLKRALASVRSQSFTDFHAYIVNDDPDDAEVEAIVDALGDERFYLFQPVEKRGAGRNFNLMFGDVDAAYVALLEDDNWWEPTFLEEMVALMKSHQNCEAACSNERIWKESADGRWVDTGVDIWPNFGLRRHVFAIESLCGSAKLCNSAMLYRRSPAKDLRTPDDIPVDVTEHFRERLLTGDFMLSSLPLVNYAETLKTARGGRDVWGDYQALLIGSVFAAIKSPAARIVLARRLWAEVSSPTSPRAVALLSTGLTIKDARALALTAPTFAWVRFLFTVLRRPRAFTRSFSGRVRLAAHFETLRDAPVTQRVAAAFERSVS